MATPIKYIPIRDDRNKYIINIDSVICIRSTNRRAGLSKDDMDWVIEVVCYKDLVFTLTYKIVTTRNKVFNALWRQFELNDAIKNTAPTHYDLNLLEHRTGDEQYDDECIGIEDYLPGGVAYEE